MPQPLGEGNRSQAPPSSLVVSEHRFGASATVRGSLRVRTATSRVLVGLSRSALPRMRGRGDRLGGRVQGGLRRFTVLPRTSSLG